MTSPKLACPHCGEWESRVSPDITVGYRVTDQGGYRRVRVCEHCHGRFTSIESVEGPLPPKIVQPPSRIHNI